MEFREYIIEEALILIPVLIILGKFLKELPFLLDRYIPLILLFISVVLAVFLIGMSIEAVIQGILVAGAAVLGHQLVKQNKNISSEL
ncbi:holin [Halalkalibacillus sediminis]|uniref:Holin n=1 Tax=Halalkalibacillus sediminis TaxID=2018042 RepID=A0A2I0QXZ2_9BACI|nr:phage holin family protein [Halalkalibacillus sediminis]PKR79178.1 holin [Halalkalibacillus sediminis]